MSRERDRFPGRDSNIFSTLPFLTDRLLLAWCAAAIACSAVPRAAALTLEESIAQALDRNELAAAADEQTRAADARVAKARSFFFPDLTLLGESTRRSHETTRTVDGETTTLQRRDALEARVTVSGTIFDAQAFPLLAAARRAREAARFGALDAKQRLAHETARAFLVAWNAEHVASAADERLVLARRNLEEVRVRFGAELIGSNDVTRAELEAASAEREEVLARGSARTARVELGHLLDLEVTDELTTPESLLDEAADPIVEGVPIPADPKLRPDILAERARVAALRASASEPRRRYLPDLGYTGTAWKTNESGFSERDEDWSLGLNLTWDLFDGGEREADRGERTALARAASLDLVRLERRVDADVEEAKIALDSEQASLARAEVAVDAARRNAAETTELYRQGIARALEVVDANVQLFEAEVGRAGARSALAIAFLDWRAALGLPPLDEENGP